MGYGFGLLDEFLHAACAHNLLASGANALATPNRSRRQQIDRLVYELYGLTEEEIQIVEKG
jgi:hypothetical protein